MGMTPRQFFESFVEGNAEDYLEHPGDVRRAFNAAVSASHAADHYYEYHGRHRPQLIAAYTSLGTFVEHLCAKTDGAFRDIRSVSNAYKHLYTDASSRFGTHAPSIPVGPSSSWSSVTESLPPCARTSLLRSRKSCLLAAMVRAWRSRPYSSESSPIGAILSMKTPNSSIERTSQRPLGALCVAAHVERWGSLRHPLLPQMK